MTKATYDEAMMALDDGRVVKCNRIRLPNYHCVLVEGVLWYTYGDLFQVGWLVMLDDFPKGCPSFEILPEYYLTFAEAMMVVQRGGKVVANNEDGLHRVGITGKNDLYAITSGVDDEWVSYIEIEDWWAMKFKEVFEGA